MSEVALIGQGRRMIIEVDDWIHPGDGKQHKMVWGRCWYHQARELFGFDPKAGANYFVQVGEGDGCIFIAGCRIHYAWLREDKPTNSDIYVPPSELLS